MFEYFHQVCRETKLCSRPTVFTALSIIRKVFFLVNLNMSGEGFEARHCLLFYNFGATLIKRMIRYYMASYLFSVGHVRSRLRGKIYSLSPP